MHVIFFHFMIIKQKSSTFVTTVSILIVNKVIRPKSRASALSKTVRQTDRQTDRNDFFFKTAFYTAIYYSKLLLHYSDMKNAIKRH